MSKTLLSRWAKGKFKRNAILRNIKVKMMKFEKCIECDYCNLKEKYRMDWDEDENLN